MAFHIYVERKRDSAYIYDRPLGTDGTVYDRWHAPAHRLGLRLLSEVYDNGLNVEGAELDELSDELNALETFWDKKFIRVGPISYRTVDIDMVWLKEESDPRIGYLREAIRIAQECDGSLRIF
ncbi:MAG: hypothetical protein AAF579_14720 [Cyanobacteria bacterium P01_C01_bin.118]